MIGAIPFGIPEKFAAGLADGSVIRIGALLKDSGTGQILAHLQETGIAHNIFGAAALSPFSPISAISSIGENVQLHHLTKLTEGLKILQYASLGVSIAGIGVSAIGFALMNKKLNRLQGDISALTQRLEHHFQELKERDFRKHFSRIHGLYRDAQIAFDFRNPSTEWRRIAAALSDESSFFIGELRQLLAQEKFELDLFTSLIASFGICNAGRIECLLLAREVPAAVSTADGVAQDYRVFDAMNPIDLSKQCRSSPKKMMHFIHGVRDAQDAALTKPFLLNTLMEKGIDSRAYVTALREAKEHPILVLSAT